MVRLQRALMVKPLFFSFSLHPTMVRLQLLEKHLKRLVQAASPSHYGSTATIFLHPPIRGFLQSPSHYGSTATLRKHQRRIREEAVSIPLWFDCNGGGSPARAGPAQGVKWPAGRRGSIEAFLFRGWGLPPPYPQKSPEGDRPLRQTS